MSSKDEKASTRELEGPPNGSVFDFLYHDSRRIASFLSQFDNNGLLTGLTHSDSATKNAKRGKKFDLGGNVPLLGGGHVGLEIGAGESGVESLERVYDPFWANARQFLDALEDNGMIQRDVESATMGQFVLVTGRLIIADLQMLQSVWDLPAIQDALRAAMMQANSEENEPEPANRQQRRAQAKKPSKNTSANSELEMVMQLLPHLPHAGQAHLVTDDFGIWASLDVASLVGTMSDLVLKHGNKLAGDWAMLGILDGKPFDHDNILTADDMLRAGLIGQGSLTNAAVNLGPITRQALGRPLGSYGITPLLIFREVV